MIGSRARLGSGFKGLQQYLLHGKDGASPERSVWTSTRNLRSTDPEHAATVMRQTARTSKRVEKPVYHLSVSLAPGERLERRELEAVADRLLRDLGLEHHQVLIAEHADGVQQHIHLMVNRVHPETSRAWSTYRDFNRIERSLRAQERELGLRIVPGRHAPVPGHARFVGARASGRPFVREVRERAGNTLRTAESWQALHAGLSRAGLRIDPGPRGRGLVITDGRRYAAPSKVDRAASRSRLEARLGSYQPASPDLQRLIAVARDLQTRGRLDALRARYEAAARELGDALADHHKASVRLDGASRSLDRLLGETYRDPAGARRALDTSLARHGVGQTLSRLESRPARFGRLLGTPATPTRGAARRALRDRAPTTLRRYVSARRAEHSAMRRLERFRANPKHPVLAAAHRARAILARALRRLERIDRRLAPPPASPGRRRLPGPHPRLARRRPPRSAPRLPGPSRRRLPGQGARPDPRSSSPTMTGLLRHGRLRRVRHRPLRRAIVPIAVAAIVATGPSLPVRLNLTPSLPRGLYLETADPSGPRPPGPRLPPRAGRPPRPRPRLPPSRQLPVRRRAGPEARSPPPPATPSASPPPESPSPAASCRPPRHAPRTAPAGPSPPSRRVPPASRPGRDLAPRPSRRLLGQPLLRSGAGGRGPHHHAPAPRAPSDDHPAAQAR